ncbi:DENN (AEX-3) domain-containing protein [Ditylenchus destructor]|uniref:DENN (AEX-3) domain-containing protein n=1 Tax=Ditylenchus destructor TaxID=166010 RepID=A0AAD4N695_9BILA|nr:DENN (AEX-3) domain-containing protein [Ditylenchus destructor]
MEAKVKSKMKQPYPNSSLIRRARLIRRSTTNQYCEQLKQLKEDDGSVIHQILIIRLKTRSNATDYERACVNTSTAKYIPSVDFAYPPMGSNRRKFPPPLFYPDFTKCTVQRKESLEAYSVILTNEKGDRTFAYCFKFLSKYPPEEFDLLLDDEERELRHNSRYSVLVFVSVCSEEVLFHQLASDFVSAIQKDSTKIYSMCKDLLNLTLSTSEEAYKRSKYVISQNLQWSRCDIYGAIKKIGVQNSILIFLSLLAEKRIIITGSNVTDVSKAVQSFVRLLAPMEWPHTLIPIIPDSQTELCHNPTPYICGILRYNLNRVKDLLCPLPEDHQDEVTVLDVERGVVLPSLEILNSGSATKEKQFNSRVLINYACTMGFPKSAVSDLLASVKSCLTYKNSDKSNYKIEKAVMIFYAKLFGHYKQFGEDILTARNRKRFAHAHPCSDVRLFLTWFVENGILQSFIFQNSQGSQRRVHRLDSRFEEILKKYSPPVSKKGKRKKAKSLMWKLFTR